MITGGHCTYTLWQEGTGGNVIARRIVWLLCLTGTFVLAMAQSVPARFLLELGNKQIGKADYQFTAVKSGFRLKAHYSYVTGGTSIEAIRQAELGPNYELKSDSLSVHINDLIQSASITADERSGKLNYDGGVTGGSRVTNTFDMHHASFVFNNFDPS